MGWQSDGQHWIAADLSEQVNFLSFHFLAPF
jgi:hypothetical protein